MQHQFQIQDGNYNISKSAALKKLRAAGFTVQRSTVINTNRIVNVDKQNVISRLCRSGRLKEIWRMEDTLVFDPLSKPGQEKKKDLKKERLSFAYDLACAYHNRFKSLYNSEKGEINIGSGASYEEDWNYYAKSYNHPARWKNAGCYIRNNKIVLENYRGSIVLEYDLPVRQLRKKMDFETNALIYGDLFGINIRKNIFERFNQKGEMVGYAVLMNLFGKNYWEHGRTLQIVKEEYQHKLLVEEKRRKEIALNKKLERAKSLTRRLVNDAMVSYSDARAVGYCDTGIKNFCKRWSINPDSSIRIAVLKRIDGDAEKVIDYVITNLVKKRFLNS